MNERGFELTSCPTCGSPEIRKIQDPWKGTFQGKAYTVPGLVYFSCPVCEEKVYLPDAMRKIHEASPAYSKPFAPPAERRRPLRKSG